uniref:molybdenum cofactor guanylyltransferase n=1 Tax=Eggerthella sinensis TaxID=242230 RepID=UPI0022E4FB6A
LAVGHRLHAVHARYRAAGDDDAREARVAPSSRPTKPRAGTSRRSTPAVPCRRRRRRARGARRAEQQADEAAGGHFKTQHPDYADISNKLPTSDTVAIVTDIEEARRAAELYHVPAFALDDIAGLADFVEQHYVRPRVTVVIQAGGESRRMGQSKATVPFAGRPLICRLVERLGPVADDLVITTNEPENLAFLHGEFPQYRIQLVCDAFNVRGALPGLYTALQAARNPYVAVVACDMVFASASLVVPSAGHERVGRRRGGARQQARLRAVHAMYRRMGCLPAVRAALDRGEKRAQGFFADVNVCEFPQERVLEAEPMGGCFINANTPEELNALEETFLAK